MPAQKFIRLVDGTIYGFTELLATRKDATVVGVTEAVKYFQALGIENDLTREHGAAATVEEKPSRKKTARVKPADPVPTPPQTQDSDESPPLPFELDDDVKRLLDG